MEWDGASQQQAELRAQELWWRDDGDETLRGGPSAGNAITFAWHALSAPLHGMPAATLLP